MPARVDSPLVARFPGAEGMTIVEVGGKADSLIRMINAGLPVPSGAVLTVRFFAPWLEAVRQSRAWRELVEADPAQFVPHCDAVKKSALSYPMTAQQKRALAALHQALVVPGGAERFAVRSSSPDEDLASASFAGGYETVLGVHADEFETALRRCFASLFDPRVLSYKKALGVDLWSPRIAVVIQQQLASTVAGVAFSLNPVTNDYDEAVITANWGLGTSVVDGATSPDHFVVDKVAGRLVEETPGDKQVSYWLDPDSGVIERTGHRCAERSLSDAQLREVTDLVCRVEDLYGLPIDIEWAYTADGLHVLQARPITRYVPLTAEMMTAPGERRRLYADAALSKGMTTNTPISPLGLDNLEHLFSMMIENWLGPLEQNVAPRDSVFFFAGGRMYVNYSSILWLASADTIAGSAAPTDVLMARILRSVDSRRYRARQRPAWISVRLLWRIPRALWRARRFFGNLLRAVLAPERAYRVYRQQVDAFETELKGQIDSELALDEFRSRYATRMAHEMFDVLMPALLVGMVSADRLVRRRNGASRALAARIKTGTPGNIVVEMGIALHRLAKQLEHEDFSDLEQLAERIGHGNMPAEFLGEWKAFHARFGWRGPLEMDLASARYADDPRLMLRQMSFMAVDDPEFDPDSAHQHRAAERDAAYQALMARFGPIRRRLLRRIYRLNELFTGTRDLPKHLLVLYSYGVRKRALAAGRRLVKQGKLDAADDVFSLAFEHLRDDEPGRRADLRAISEQRTRFQKKLNRLVTSFPLVIDSRGRIPRPSASEATPGVLTGMAVSPGVVSGPVKVLNTPHEKAVEKGDVIVAYTTDPGWTPLFVNAAAIVLEVGGMLQHGALVAREYGKPCVVGIDRLLEQLQDGQHVEVDGDTGIVRLLESA